MASPHRSIARGTALALVAVGVLALTGCRSQPIVRPSPIHSPLGAEQNRAVILRGLVAHRWQPVSEEPGLVTARFDRKRVGKYVATVDILYDDESIEIRYRDSKGLRCEPADAPCETIHRAYNRWVVQLSRDIEYGVQTVRLESVRPPAVGAGVE